MRMSESVLDFCVRAVERQRDPTRCRDRVVLQHRVSAVLARADGDAFLVQQGGKVVTVCALSTNEMIAALSTWCRLQENQALVGKIFFVIGITICSGPIA